MWNTSGNHTYTVSKATAVADTTPADGNLSQIVSPEKSVFTEKADEGKYLVSGSFDMWFRDPSRYNFAFVYGYDTAAQNYQYALIDGDKRGNYFSNAFSVDFANEADAVYNDMTNKGVFNTAFGNYWLHYEFMFDSDNNLNIAVSDNTGKTLAYKYDVPVAKENRILGFAKPYYSGSREIHFDNVVMNFGGTDSAVNGTAYNDALDLYVDQYTKETLEISAERIAPYDFERINYTVAKFEEACAAAPTIKNDTFFTEPVTKLPLFKANVEAWGDVSTDDKVAASFYNLYFNKSEVNYTVAFNIYRRLTKAQRKAFEIAYPTEFAAMNNAVANSGVELEDETDVIKIAAVGDSITYGVGSTDGQSYPNQLLALLNADGIKYDINNQGMPGIRIVHSSGITDDTVMTGEYRALTGYYNSINYNPDIVMIMLGTNDAHRNENFLDTNGDLTANRYKQYKAVYTDLIQSFMSLECSPQVVLVTIPQDSGKGAGWTKKAIALRSLYQEIADEYDLPLFDMFKFTDENLESSDYRDALHPVNSGYTKMSNFFFDKLNEYTMSDTAAAFTMAPKLNLFGDANDNGKADLGDLVAIKKYIADNTNSIKTVNVDFDASGVIDADDREVFRKYLLGYPVEDNITGT